MCGLFGTINFKIDPAIPQAELYHRGPDEQTFYRDKNLILIHTRLAIQDIKQGTQPIHLGEYVIIFNGEIYNHLDLRNKHNLRCKTNSDTETVLHLYKKFGEAFLNDLDGMFIIIIYNREKQKLFIARDRAGKKPLYIYKKNNYILFSSELNALRKIIPLEIEPKNIYSYLRFGFFARKTPYRDVEEIGPGSILYIDLKTLQIEHKRWWLINNFYTQKEQYNYNEAKLKVETLLHTAVKRRMLASDLEVGTFLSGGIDSGLVTAFASKFTNKLKTFTIQFPGQYNEAPLAKLVASKFGTDHNEIKIDYSNLHLKIEDILSAYGEPFSDSSAIPTYYVSREAKKYLTVILNGDGADELFAGYRRHAPFSKFDFFNSRLFVRYTAKYIKRWLPIAHNKMSKLNYLSRLLDIASKQGVEIYLASTVDAFEGFEDALEGSIDFLEDLNKIYMDIIKSSYTPLQKILILDFNLVLPGDFLVKVDISSMRNSLETRSPFLAKEILEFAPLLQDKYKIKGSSTKYILRDLAKQYLPSPVYYQPKRGFEAPIKHWIEYELHDVIFDYLNNNPFLQEYAKKDFIQLLLQRRINVSDEKRAKMIWKLFALAVWYNYERK